MKLKGLIQEIDAVAQNWLPIPQPLSREMAAWADLHGWNLADPGCHCLLIRQALLNACIRSLSRGAELIHSFHEGISTSELRLAT